MRDYQKYIDTDEIYLFNIGEARRLMPHSAAITFLELSAHRFVVWAPNARSVSVVGDLMAGIRSKSNGTQKQRRLCDFYF